MRWGWFMVSAQNQAKLNSYGGFATKAKHNSQVCLSFPLSGNLTDSKIQSKALWAYDPTSPKMLTRPEFLTIPFCKRQNKENMGYNLTYSQCHRRIGLVFKSHIFCKQWWCVPKSWATQSALQDETKVQSLSCLSHHPIPISFSPFHNSMSHNRRQDPQLV